ncbi:MAG: hypothetical protein ACYCPH_01965 [Minisyncoccota bacterium]
MDEILIEDRKYVSSKRAAKITGYAKDYIGQLCREGRVPARLVGRSWYVLEAAIHDHRFGAVADEPAKAIKDAESPLQSTWDAPRYEASSAELLPSINRLSGPEIPDDQEKAADEEPQRLQDSWQAWFNRMADHTEPIISPIPENIEPEQAPEPESEPELEQEKAESEEVNIPIHAVYQPVFQEPLPPITKVESLRSDLRIKEEQEGEQPRTRPARPIRNEAGKGSKRVVMRRIRIFGISLAIISVLFAAIGSGYLNTYVSGSPVEVLAGISIYNK